MSIRPIKRLIKAKPTVEGAGVHLRRAFGFGNTGDFDPFLLLDDFRNDRPEHYLAGFPWHPHRGIETITYVLAGSVEHGDSLGNQGVIAAGDVQWMTAGSGILHIETPPEALVVKGGLFHGLQLWVNLPARSKMIEPRYQNLEPDLVSLLTTADAGSLIRVIAGEIDGHTGPGGTHTPITVAHATVQPGERMTLPWNPAYNALGYVLAGDGTVGAESHPVSTGNLVVFGPGDSFTFTAGNSALELYLLGGQPIREPVAQYGPFVMNTRAELQQAFDDFQAGRLGTVPPDGLRPYRG